MLFDLHVHQSEHSADSILSIEQAVLDAKNKNLNGICITDHDDLGLRDQARLLSLKHGITIIVGVEIYTYDGDLLCFGVDEMPERMSAKETIEFVHERGGICIAAHPYRHNNRGVKDELFNLNLDAIEAFNGRTMYEDNVKALEVARTLGIPVTGGSDAHTPGEIGNYVTKFENEIYNEFDFIQAIKSGEFSPVTLNGLSIDTRKLA